jgi:thioredoxin-related protein
MKRNLFLMVLFTSIGFAAFSQEDTTLLYLRFPTVPPFSIIKAPDSIKFTKDDLQKKKPVMIMIFNPDCEHCQHETRELIAHMDLFKKVQIIMTSPLEYYYIKKFYDDYKIADYPNIIMGRDPGYYFGTFFHIRYFPAIFLYDKKGNFVGQFDGSVPVEKIAAAL